MVLLLLWNVELLDSIGERMTELPLKQMHELPSKLFSWSGQDGEGMDVLNPFLVASTAHSCGITSS